VSLFTLISPFELFIRVSVYPLLSLHTSFLVHYTSREGRCNHRTSTWLLRPLCWMRSVERVMVSSLSEGYGLMEIASDTVLLQLQALFGPMLTSALHLVDKRDGQLAAPCPGSELIGSRTSFPSSRPICLSSGSLPWTTVRW
jgi:hypothetical protein